MGDTPLFYRASHHPEKLARRSSILVPRSSSRPASRLLANRPVVRPRPLCPSSHGPKPGWGIGSHGEARGQSLPRARDRARRCRSGSIHAAARLGLPGRQIVAGQANERCSAKEASLIHLALRRDRARSSGRPAIRRTPTRPAGPGARPARGRPGPARRHPPGRRRTGGATAVVGSHAAASRRHHQGRESRSEGNPLRRDSDRRSTRPNQGPG